MQLDALLEKATALGASDLHLRAGNRPMVRVHGVVRPLPESDVLSASQTAKMASSILDQEQKQRFKECLELDFAYGVEGLGRFRANVFRQRMTLALVFRVIPSSIPKFEDLNLPEVLHRIAEEPRGLVLVTGTTGSGKSTTLASMIDHINRTRACHVLTVEDPIEYMHRDRKAVITQREVGVDTRSFGGALRAALRQDPDVILVGEMRDLETVDIALTAAETGHLVLSTLHTVNAAQTIHRITSLFPPHQEELVRLRLGALLRAVVSQRLVPRKNGKGLIPAVEVLVNTGLVREYIEDKERTRDITDALAKGSATYGTQTFDQSLFRSFKTGLISLGEAKKHASNPDDFALRVRGVVTSSDAY